MNIHKSTSAYEDWLAGEVTIVEPDLRAKHQAMRGAVFPFLRATFYRWCQLWPEVCESENAAPEVLAVGDLHIDNFGTWRDVEGRLVWGINDFDEAVEMPYTMDLVRLATSAHLAIDSSHLDIEHRDACAAILSGYKECLEAGGLPFVLGEKHTWLREIAGPALRDPVAYWKKLEELPPLEGSIPKNARRAIERLLPDPDLKYTLAHRIAGLGSLGRQRFVALADYAGAKVCREAKALAPSAWCWASGHEGEKAIHYQNILDSAVRAVDPFVRLKSGWIVRRLAPDCSRIELASLPKEKQETRLLHAMGWETANAHLGSKRATAILKDLSKRSAGWLHRAEARMSKAVDADWREWAGAKRDAPA